MTYDLKLQMQSLTKIREWAKFGEAVKVAVLDGSIDRNHPDLSKQSITGDAGETKTLHGTVVASIISGQKTGIAPSAQLIERPVFSEDAHGNLKGCSQLALARAIRNAAQAGAQVINISGANINNTGVPNDEVREAIESCTLKNIHVVAAVGNDGLKVDTIPAIVTDVIAVGAHDANGAMAPFNNIGPGMKHKTIFAPGVDILFSDREKEARISGSSFAAPVVSGVCALIRAVLPQITVAELYDLLSKSCVACPLIDAAAPQTTAAMRLDFVLLRENLGSLRTETVRPQNHIMKRKFNMSTSENTDIMIEPAAAPTPTDMIDASPVAVEIQPAIAVTETPASEAVAPPAQVPTPRIQDPALHTFVHAEQMNDTVRPQQIQTSVSMLEKVFGFGTIGYDFVNETNRDYFQQAMYATGEACPKMKPLLPTDEVSMARFLTMRDEYGSQPNMDKSTALVWTLKVDGIPVFALSPQGPFALFEFARLTEFMLEQTGLEMGQLHEPEMDTQTLMVKRNEAVHSVNKVDRVSIAGEIIGETRLYNGHVVPTLKPILRGMFSWNASVLAKSVLGKTPKKGEESALRNFLDRIYYDLRNRGVEPHHRALNFAATNAYQAKEVFQDAIGRKLELNNLDVERSPISRPGSEFYDVKFEFFDPEKKDQRARRLYRYTVDVSGSMPVTFGEMRSWNAY